MFSAAETWLIPLKRRARRLRWLHRNVFGALFFMLVSYFSYSPTQQRKAKESVKISYRV